MITGSGRVSLLSGQIQRYWVGFTLNGSDQAARDGCVPARLAEPPTLASWVERVLAHKARKNRRSFFIFNFFYKLQTNLNSNQI
jgi:hypothetical protein